MNKFIFTSILSLNLFFLGTTSFAADFHSDKEACSPARPSGRPSTPSDDDSEASPTYACSANHDTEESTEKTTQVGVLDPLYILSTEVVCLVVDRLEIPDIIRLSQTSRGWLKTLDDPYISLKILKLYKKDYPDLPIGKVMPFESGLRLLRTVFLRLKYPWCNGNEDYFARFTPAKLKVIENNKDILLLEAKKGSSTLPVLLTLAAEEITIRTQAISRYANHILTGEMKPTDRQNVKQVLLGLRPEEIKAQVKAFSEYAPLFYTEDMEGADKHSMTPDILQLTQEEMKVQGKAISECAHLFFTEDMNGAEKCRLIRDILRLTQEEMRVQGEAISECAPLFLTEDVESGEKLRIIRALLKLTPKEMKARREAISKCKNIFFTEEMNAFQKANVIRSLLQLTGEEIEARREAVSRCFLSFFSGDIYAIQYLAKLTPKEIEMRGGIVSKYAPLFISEGMNDNDKQKVRLALLRLTPEQIKASKEAFSNNTLFFCAENDYRSRISELLMYVQPLTPEQILELGITAQRCSDNNWEDTEKWMVIKAHARVSFESITPEKIEQAFKLLSEYKGYRRSTEVAAAQAFFERCLRTLAEDSKS